MSKLINDQCKQELLITALEGGSNYWYLLEEEACKIMSKYKKSSGSENFWMAIKDGKSIQIHDVEEEDSLLGTISYESMEQAEELLISEQPGHLADIISGGWDATTADVWFQYAVMGKLIFG